MLSISTSRGNLSAGLGVDLNQLKSMAHRLLINEAPEIRRYLIEIRPQLNLLPNSIDIEADVFWRQRRSIASFSCAG